MIVRLVIPLRTLPMSANDQRRAHWTEMRKAKQDVELLVTNAVKRQGVQPFSTCTVRLTWYAPDARNRDTDNMYPFLKACLDSLVKAGVLVDDNSKIVTETTCGPIIISRDRPRFELTLEGPSQVQGSGPGDLLPGTRTPMAGSDQDLPELRGPGTMPGGGPGES